jgi:hypothetical protein
MKDHLISMYIDDELDLDAKIDFVETVHTDRRFKDETVALLEQEKLIRSDLTDRLPAMALEGTAEKSDFWREVKTWLRPAVAFASGLAAALLVLVLLPNGPDKQTDMLPYRFVIYQPAAAQAEIAGTFTGWRAVPMKRTGVGGYWEITLDVPQGVHRFSYIIDHERRTADPTIPTRERDDFGGENSIFEIKKHI